VKKVIITGSSGFIGSHFTELFMQDGYEVVGIDIKQPRSFCTPDYFYPIDLSIPHNPTLQNTIDSHSSDVESIVHLAASPIVNSSGLSMFVNNVNAAANILNCAEKGFRVICVTTDKTLPAELAVEETISPVFSADEPYRASKLCVEAMAAYQQRQAPNTSIVRFGNVFGGYDRNWSRLVPECMSAIRAKRPAVLRSNGKYIRSWVYVKDAYAGIKKVSELKSQQPVYHFSAWSLSVMEMVEAINKYVGVFGKIVNNSCSNEIFKQTISCVATSQILGWKPAFNLRDALQDTWEEYNFHA
jgi:CDP-glucose 4,6-dehydratase